ncbi:MULTISPECIES: hypothetical protein [unclassified Streptomyces]|uniref:hypothetical protein n=1 Tax=unclassified Streptomyces TaxID=2593676 RepID=UPI002E2F406C|nr:hypothetical protein [Streptomyces sp. NBC_01455]
MTSTDLENDGMAQRELTPLLTDAADGFEVGVAPIQAVMRAGGRRRARRRTVTAVAAVVLAGSTGALALTGLPGTDDPATPAKPAPADGRQVDEPQISHVGFGTYEGKQWGVNVQVWAAPRDRTEATRQMKAMNSWGLTPATTGGPSDLVGRTSYFVLRGYGDSGTRLVAFDTVGKLPRPEGTDIHAVPQPLTGDGAPLRLVVGTVAKTAKQVACHWKDGSTTLADLAPENSAQRGTQAVIRSVHGYPTANWFVCVAPGSTTYKSAEVTK